MKKIKVLIVDDSLVVRTILSEIIGAQSDMEVVGTAEDPYVAREKIKQLNPDVLTLDIEMPRMDGVTFLKNLMRLRPMPVIMISTLTEAGAEITLEALNIGAFDFVAKPKENQGKGLSGYADEITTKIRHARHSNVNELARRGAKDRSVSAGSGSTLAGYAPSQDHLVVIGASTGGTEAIKDVLLGLPANCPPTLVTQHIPSQFSASYASRLNACCPMTVHEAEANQKLLPGHVYIAPGDQHLMVKKSGAGFATCLSDGERVNRHKPSVDVLFDSLIKVAPADATGVLLTGMGRDGAEALLRMKMAGYQTIIQDESSSVVWGMPGAAYKLNAHTEMKPLDSIAKHLLKLTNRKNN